VPSSHVFRRVAACVAAIMMTGALTGVPAAADHAGPQPGPVNAGTTYGWFPKKWKYDWGEEAYQGLRPWRISSSGTGTAYIRWGLIVLDSSVDRFNAPSRGSVAAILGRHGARYGRWELRLRAPVWYDAGREYKVRAELVPADRTKRRCNARNIALATFTAGGSHVNVFARNAGRQWTFTKRDMTLDRASWHTYAVEVTPRRISWFIDAHVVATLRNSRATSDVLLTPRLWLRGIPGVAMDRARISVDWVRHFTLDSPNRKSVRAPAPTVTTRHPC
jgi:Glycosyl hydrolases family 16